MSQGRSSLCRPGVPGPVCTCVGMSKNTSIALVVILFGSAGALYYWRSGNINDVGAKRTTQSTLQCLDCKHEFVAEVDAAEKAPFKCAKCGKKAAWYVWQCGKCQTHFVPPPEGDPPRQPLMPSCPKCGGGMTGRVSLPEE